MPIRPTVSHRKKKSGLTGAVVSIGSMTNRQCSVLEADVIQRYSPQVCVY